MQNEHKKNDNQLGGTGEPTACPKCGGEEEIRTIEYGRDINIAWFEQECQECGFAWRENYAFTNWEEV